MPDNERTCGNCAHWERMKEYRWGSCLAPLPFWMEDESMSRSMALFPDRGEGCPCWVPRQEGEDDE